MGIPAPAIGDALEPQFKSGQVAQLQHDELAYEIAALLIEIDFVFADEKAPAIDDGEAFCLLGVADLAGLLMHLAAGEREALKGRYHLVANDNEQHHELRVRVATLAFQHDVALVKGALLEAEDAIDSLEAQLTILNLQHFEDIEGSAHAAA